MQALCEGRLVRIDQPDLLEHIFLLTGDINTQGMLLCTSKAWVAACKKCAPLTVSIGLRRANSGPLRRGWLAGGKTLLPPGGLPAAAAWLAQQRGLVPGMRMRLDPISFPGQPCRGEAGPSPLPDTVTLQAQAAAVVTAAPGLRSLHVWSECDIQWLPRLAGLTHLWLDFSWDPEEYAGDHGPLDCIARVAPQLRSLTLETYLAEDEDEPPSFGPTATLPPSLTRMHINGQVLGLGPHLSQLVRLAWHPLGRRTWFRLPIDAVDGLSQASQLTDLVLSAPSPASIPAFFRSLACLTGLRDLSIQGAFEDGCVTLFNRQYYADAVDYDYVLEELLPEALEEMTSLTYLGLTGHDMPVCPYSLAHLPQLKRLDLGGNEGLTELPHGPWPALEYLGVDPELVEAALANPPALDLSEDGGPAGTEPTAGPQPAAEEGHALWSLRRLTSLDALWMGGNEEEKEEMKQAIRRLLPQLQHIS